MGNIAEVEAYRRWVAKRAEWTPLGFTPEVYDSGLTGRHILEEPRDIDLFMMIDRLRPWRQVRMDALEAAFLDAYFCGRGWPRGYLPSDQQVAFLRRSRIGPNIHSSTGRSTTAPSTCRPTGCSRSAPTKAIWRKSSSWARKWSALTPSRNASSYAYYHAHEEERKIIAVNGSRRAMRDYNEVAIFRRNLALIEAGLRQCGAARPAPARSVALEQSECTPLRRTLQPPRASPLIAGTDSREG